MRRSLVFIVLLFVLLSFGLPPRHLDGSPMAASAQLGACGVSHYDIRDGSNYVFLGNRIHDPCPRLCPPEAPDVAAGHYSDDINSPVAQFWCAGTPQPPDKPAVNAGAVCLGGSSRTVTLVPQGGDYHEIEISTGGVTVGTSHSYTGLQHNVAYSFRGQSSDSNGSSGWSDWAGPVRQDRVAPSTAIDIVGVPGTGGWFMSDVSVALLASDNGCLGVSQTNYSLDGTPFVGTSFVISGEGTHSLSVSSTDGHNAEAAQNRTISIDKSAPTLSVAPDRLPDVGAWWTSPVMVSGSTSDAVSGVVDVRYTLDGVVWQTGDAVTVATDGVYNVDMQATDHAGWSANDGVVIQLDGTQPSVSIVPDHAASGANGWWQDAVNVEVSASDATSGVEALVVSTDGGATFAPYGGVLGLLTEGVYVIDAVARDYAGNLRSERLTIPVDLFAPVVDIHADRAPDAGSWWTAPVSVSIQASDTMSGVATVEYAVNGGAWQAGDTLTLSEDGTYAIDVRVTDLAGHSQQGTVTIPLDNSHPTLAIRPDRAVDGWDGWWLDSVVVTIEADDSTSGIQDVLFSVDGGATFTPYTEPLHLGEGIHTVDAVVRNGAGQVSQARLQVPIDGAQPFVELQITGESGDGYWYGTAPVFRASTSDTMSGVKQVMLSVDGRDSLYYGPFQVGTEGEHTVGYSAMDYAGHGTSAQTIRFGVDLTSPQVTDMQFACADGQLQVTASASDDRSGLWHSRLSAGDLVVESDYDHLASTEIQHTLETTADEATLTVQDTAGNRVTVTGGCTRPVTVIETPPEVGTWPDDYLNIPNPPPGSGSSPLPEYGTWPDDYLAIPFPAPQVVVPLISKALPTVELWSDEDVTTSQEPFTLTVKPPMLTWLGDPMPQVIRVSRPDPEMAVTPLPMSLDDSLPLPVRLSRTMPYTSDDIGSESRSVASELTFDDSLPRPVTAISPVVSVPAPLSEGGLPNALAAMGALATVAAGVVSTLTAKKREDEAEALSRTQQAALASAQADQQARLDASLAENAALRAAAQEVAYVQGANSDWLNTYHDLVAGYGDRVYQWQQAVIAQQAGEIQARLLKAKDIIGEVAVYANEVGRTDFELSLDALVLANWGLYDGNRLGNEGTVQLSLDLSFAAARFALQRYGALDGLNGESYQNEVNARTETYKQAVSNAFNASFIKLNNPEIDDEESEWHGSDWDLVRIHFARQGFEATACAFEGWVEQTMSEVEDQPYGTDVDRFDLFSRIMGHTTLINHYETHEHFAEAFAQADGSRIEIYKRPANIKYLDPDSLEEFTREQLSEEDVDNYIHVIWPGTRQAIITPNNLIHELGHLFSKYSSTYVRVTEGSIELEMEQQHIPTETREGMGLPNHDRFFAPAFWDNDFRIRDYPPTVKNATLTYQQLVDILPDSVRLPEDYLAYDLFGDNTSLWGKYTPWPDDAVRIDSMMHNPTDNYSETTADAFLNWVRNSFSLETTQGQRLQTFFDQNIGMFIRNSIVAHMGETERVSYENGRYDIPDGANSLTGIIIMGDDDQSFFLKTYPTEDEYIYSNSRSIIGDEVRVLGRNPANTPEDVENWLLIELDSGRRFWIAQNSVQFPTDASIGNLPVVNAPSIDSPFVSGDLELIVVGGSN